MNMSVDVQQWINTTGGIFVIVCELCNYTWVTESIVENCPNCVKE